VFSLTCEGPKNCKVLIGSFFTRRDKVVPFGKRSDTRMGLTSQGKWVGYEGD